MNIKGAIFDCDGTLVDSLGFWKYFYINIGDAYCNGVPFTPTATDDKAMRTMVMRDVANLMHKNYGIAQSAQALEKFSLALLEKYYVEVVELKPGVRELLEHLKKCGVRMCVASASEQYLVKLILTRHNIIDYFEDVIACSAVGAGKDKPDVFFAAEKFLGTSHDSTWVFEDSPLAIETAKSAGFKVAAIYDQNTPYQERIKEISDEYVGEGESFTKLLPKIK